MFETRSARATLRLAILVLVSGAFAGLWEVLASQAPGSLLYVAMLPGPVQTLRESAFTLGLLLLSASILLPRAERRPGSRMPALITAALHVGTLLALVASAYGAAHGMHGEQFQDLRPDATALFIAKHAGYALIGSALLVLAARVLRGLHAQ